MLISYPMDRLGAMEAFVAVAELRGFAPAARRLNLSTSSVSRLVSALEERLSIRLLQRTTRSVTLTAAGARYLARAQRILADVDEAEGGARADQLVPAGRFVVAAPNVFGRLEVAPLMCDFMARHPAVVGELTLADRMVSLIEEGIDVAIRIGVLSDSTLIVRKVGETRRVIVGAPGYLASRKRPIEPSDLASHAIIQFTALTPTAEWRLFRGDGEKRVSFAPAFVTNSADAAVRQAEFGGGLAMVFGYQAADAIKAGRLEVALAKYEPPPSPIQIVYPTTRHLSANVRAFVDLAVATRSWHFVDL